MIPNSDPHKSRLERTHPASFWIKNHQNPFIDKKVPQISIVPSQNLGITSLTSAVVIAGESQGSIVLRSGNIDENTRYRPATSPLHALMRRNGLLDTCDGWGCMEMKVDDRTFPEKKIWKKKKFHDEI